MSLLLHDIKSNYVGLFQNDKNHKQFQTFQGTMCCKLMININYSLSKYTCNYLHFSTSRIHPITMFYYSCVFGKHNYRVLIGVCVCVFPCLCVYVCVCTTSKKKLKLEYIVVYENNLDEFDIEVRWIKVKGSRSRSL